MLAQVHNTGGRALNMTDLRSGILDRTYRAQIKFPHHVGAAMAVPADQQTADNDGEFGYAPVSATVALGALLAFRAARRRSADGNADSQDDARQPSPVLITSREPAHQRPSFSPRKDFTMRTRTHPRLRFPTSAGAVVAITVGILSAAPAATAATAASDPGHGYRHLCAEPVHANQAACHAIVSTTPAVPDSTVTPRNAPAGYGPADLRSAYGITANGSAKSTIAIIDAFDDPRAESDLAVYRSRFGLPPCTTADRCFRKMDQTGGTRYPAADAGWAGEISLDLDVASAICRNCHLLLVEAASADLGNLGRAVDTAVAAGARYVSNSYGGAEDRRDRAAAAAHFNHPGIVITASAGDSGYGVEYPASAKTVTAVGGTSLVRAANSRGWTETVWGTAAGDGTGSGCSTWMMKPYWQTDPACHRRTVADVAAVADPNTGVAVYDTYESSGWNVYGGTSVAAPLIAAVYAVAGTPGPSDYPVAYPYEHPTLLWDVISGSNGSCGGGYLCTARSGYDGPTGLGTPHGPGAFRAPTR